MLIETELDADLEETMILIRSFDRLNLEKLKKELLLIEERKSNLVIKTVEGIQKIKYHDILFFEIFNDNLILHLEDDLVETKGRLYKMVEELSDSRFVQVHKSIVVNTDKIEKLEHSFSGNQTAILITGEKIPVSRRFLNLLKQKIISKEGE